MSGASAKAGPTAPTPKIRAMREIMRAFVDLPRNHDLEELNDFRTLEDLLDDTVVNDHLLRTLTIEILKDDEIGILIEFRMDWRKKIIRINGTDADVDHKQVRSEMIAVAAGGEAAMGREFVRLFSRRLHEVLVYLDTRMEKEGYAQADWSVSLREDNQPAMQARALELEKKYGLIEPTEKQLDDRRRFKASDPEPVTYTTGRISDFLLNIFQRRRKK